MSCCDKSIFTLYLWPKGQPKVGGDSQFAWVTTHDGDVRMTFHSYGDAYDWLVEALRQLAEVRSEKEAKSNG